MKTKLIELAKKIGFGAILMQNVIYRAYPDLEPIRYYLWMCELQKWCREKHQIYVTITQDFYVPGINFLYQILIYDPTNEYNCLDKRSSGLYGDNGEYGTYEQALEEGLYQTLLLIQEENERGN